jgi:hypothetical protein
LIALGGGDGGRVPDVADERRARRGWPEVGPRCGQRVLVDVDEDRGRTLGGDGSGDLSA